MDVVVVREVLPVRGGCLVTVDGMGSFGFGFGFDELEPFEVPCPNCDRKNDADARTCWWCGVGVPVRA